MIDFLLVEFRKAPVTCAQPACNDDPQFCPGVMVCEPIPPPYLEEINNVVIYLFTLEYLGKLVTCWAVSDR